MGHVRWTHRRVTRWLLAGLAGASLALGSGCSTADEIEDESPLSEPIVEDSPVTEVDNLPEDPEEIPGGDGLVGDYGPVEEPTGAGMMAMVITQPQGYVGREVSGVVKVEEVISDRGFWITQDGTGSRLFVVLHEPRGEVPVDINAGQIIRLRGTLRDLGEQVRVDGQLEPQTQRVLSRQPFFLLTSTGQVAIMERQDRDLIKQVGADPVERERNAQRVQRFQQWDRDRDTRLSRQEVEAGFGESGVFDRFDTDGDAFLDEEEVAGGFADTWDTSDDGLIDRGEYAAGAGIEGDAGFDALDADRDDAIASEEFRQNVARWPYYERIDINEDRRIDRREMGVSMFDDLDADNDEFVDEDEFGTIDDDIFATGFDDEEGIGVDENIGMDEDVGLDADIEDDDNLGDGDNLGITPEGGDFLD